MRTAMKKPAPGTPASLPRRRPRQLDLPIDDPVAPLAAAAASPLGAALRRTSEPNNPGPHSLHAPVFYRVRDVVRITALSRPTLYRRIAAGRFPAPVHLGGRACAWSHNALQAWIADPEGYRSRPAHEMPVRRGRGRPRKVAA